MDEKEEQLQLSEAQQADAEALREEMHRIETEKKSAFYKGLTVGGLTVLALCLIVFLIIPMARISKTRKDLTDMAQTTADGDSTELLTAAVRGKIERLATSIHAYYYEDVDEDQLVQGLYKGLFEGIGDKYSAYYTPEEYESMMISATASLSGIGAVLQQNPDTMQVTVNHVYEGSPAEKAGIKNGDVLVQVDDTPATSMELTELVTHVRGEKGTIVHLKLYRKGNPGYLELDVTRDIVDVPTLSGQMLDGGIGYIMIVEFGDKTATEFADVVKDLESQGMKSMIVDLRDNPGGMITSVTDILDQILPEGVTVWTEDKNGKRTEYKSDAACMDYPMAVLINGNSASASEIFAGAIRDYKYGTLIGTTSFGKGIVQSIRKMADGSAFKLTTAKYYTPNGENIHGEGIDPDIELEYEYLDPDATTYDMMQDNQILKAIQVLKDQSNYSAQHEAFTAEGVRK